MTKSTVEILGGGMVASGIAASFPVHVAINNLELVNITDLLVVVLLYAAIGYALYMSLYIISRRVDSAVLAATPLIVVLLMHGMIAHVFRSFGMSDGDALRLRYHAPVYIAAALLSKYILRRSWQASRIVKAYAIVILVFLLFGAAKIVMVSVPATDHIYNSYGVISAHDSLSERIMRRERNDVFLIVLDGYGRTDVLRERYNHDNSEFLRSLRNMGFYISDSSCSNYSQTILSMASMLDMTYLDMESVPFKDGERYRSWLARDLSRKAVPMIYKRAGYSFVTSSPLLTNYMTPSRGDIVGYRDDDLQYVSMMSSLSILPVLTRVLRVIGLDSVPDAMELYKKQLLQQIRHAQEYRDLHQPVFVLMHVVCPHPPFVLGKNNESRMRNRNFTLHDGAKYYQITGETTETYLTSYREQAEALEPLVLEMLENIIDIGENLDVVLMSDHGPGAYMDHEVYDERSASERMPNLLAVRLRSMDSLRLEQMRTPVNVFRLLLNVRCSYSMPVLPDNSYYSTYKTPWKTHSFIITSR